MWPENMHVLLLESRSGLVVVEFICLCYLCIKIAYELLATGRMIRRGGIMHTLWIQILHFLRRDLL
jgi:hypothetical protein